MFFEDSCKIQKKMMLVSQGWQVSRGSKINFISYFNIWLSAFETLRLFKVVNAFWQGFSQQTLKNE